MSKALIIATFLLMPTLGLANANLSVGYGDASKDPNLQRGFSDQHGGSYANINNTGNPVPGGDQVAAAVNFSDPQDGTQDYVGKKSKSLTEETRPPALVDPRDVGDDIGR